MLPEELADSPAEAGAAVTFDDVPTNAKALGCRSAGGARTPSRGSERAGPVLDARWEALADWRLLQGPASGLWPRGGCHGQRLQSARDSRVRRLYRDLATGPHEHGRTRHGRTDVADRRRSRVCRGRFELRFQQVAQSLW